MANQLGDWRGGIRALSPRFGAGGMKIALIVVIWNRLRKLVGDQKMDRDVASPFGMEQLSDSQQAFIRWIAIFVVIGGVASATVSDFIRGSIDVEHANIASLERENANLDAQIKEIATLESDINVLHQRQNAVESLQAMRNVPVRMMSALVQSTPETVVLNMVTQAGTRLTINGAARSNAEVAEFLKNLDAMPERFVRPELVESVSSEAGARVSGGRKALTFSIRVDLVTVTPPAVGKAK
jgi:type IV pilus assembly protein PilN